MSNGGCGTSAPVILDTDGELRWVSPASIRGALAAGSQFINNAVYDTDGPTLNRVDLDGAITLLADFSSRGVVNFHHNIDPGKTGMLLEANTTTILNRLSWKLIFPVIC